MVEILKECVKCGKSFKTTEFVRIKNHIRTSIDIFVCENCGYVESGESRMVDLRITGLPLDVVAEDVVCGRLGEDWVECLEEYGYDILELNPFIEKELGVSINNEFYRTKVRR